MVETDAPLESFRRANLLVVRTGGCLPPFCVKCGEPASGGFIQRKFSENQKWWPAGPLVHFLSMIALADWLGGLAVHVTEPIAVPLCARHKDKYQAARVLGLTLTACSAVALAILAVIRPPLPFILATLVLLLFGEVCLTGFLPIGVVFVDSRICILKGASPAFLSHLPSCDPSPSPTS